MRIFKKIIVALLIIVAIPLIIALFVPRDFKTERDIVIQRPISEVYDYVKYVKNQDNYGVWQLSDPDMQTTEQGVDGTVGFKYSWKGEEKIGSGSQTITHLVDNERIETELDFNMGEPTKSYFLLDAVTENQTKVTWGMSGRMPYPWNLMTLVYDMGKDFAQGLANLKELLENRVDGDKTFFNRYYEETFINLANVVGGLQEHQLQFKPSDTAWSISQCLEHIVLTEKMLADYIRETLNQPANPARRADITLSDNAVIEMILDRGERFPAPPNLIGNGKYDTPQAALQDLRQQREAFLTYLQNVPIEELRNRVSETPTGVTDAFQSLLFLAGHTARHTAQIEEVMSHPDFPM